MRAVGIEADSDRVEALLKELEGKDITEVIASGVSKLASVPAGGGGAMAAAGGARGLFYSLGYSAIADDALLSSTLRMSRAGDNGHLVPQVPRL